ncbi:MAG: universal stress protein [Acidobacteria bacterium]|nr:universal stress protein [Acidobacteriota bacterium]MDA1233381.1 universal stress protein [Acidobacteriota bacterium]
MSPITTILVPVDFSDQSRFAVREAASIADRFGAKLLLLHVVPKSESGFAQFRGQESLGEREAYAAAELSQVAAREAPESACEEIVLSGDVDAAVRRLVEERSVDLVIMPTSGEGPFRPYLIGSNTAKVLHDAACPVLTGAHAKEMPDACFPYYRIGCLLDLRERSDKVLQDAFDFARAYRADLTVIHVAPGFHVDEAPVADFGAAIKRSARRRLQELLERVNVEAACIVETGDLIAKAAELVVDKKLDLLVIGRGAGDDFRSDAYDLIRSSHCPVLSV